MATQEITWILVGSSHRDTVARTDQQPGLVADRSQVHDVTGDGRPADAELPGDDLLRDHGIVPNQRQNLLFSIGHFKQVFVSQTFVCKSTVIRVQTQLQPIIP